MTSLLKLPAEVRLRIFHFLSLLLRRDHEKAIYQAYRAQSPSTGYIRLGFEKPLPMALLLTCRGIRDEAIDFVFTESPLRVDVGEDNEGGGTYDHYDEQVGEHVSHVPESWTMLVRRLEGTGNRHDPSISIRQILDHPCIDRLRTLHVNHWLEVNEGTYRVSGNPSQFPNFVNQLTGLRQLVIFLDVTHSDDDPSESAMSNPSAQRSLATSPVISIASRLPSGSCIQLTYLMRETRWHQWAMYGNSYDFSDMTVVSIEGDLTAYLRTEQANGVDVGLFVEIGPALGNGNYALDARRHRQHRHVRNPGMLGIVAGCSLRPGLVRHY